jgi:hypothetical protein
MKNMGIASLATALLLLVACASEPALITRSDPAPLSIDLTGNWVQVSNSGISQPSARDTAVHVFLKMGESLKITQTGDGIFVSFDRSVVDEYRYGENRQISIGEINAERASGWAENGYVIETIDDDGALLIDTYRVRNAGESIRRTIVLLDRGRELLSLQLDFDRAWQ